jgi:hypothetical protein
MPINLFFGISISVESSTPQELTFARSGLEPIEIPSSVLFLGKPCFAECNSLTGISFERCSDLNKLMNMHFREVD